MKQRNRKIRLTLLSLSVLGLAACEASLPPTEALAPAELTFDRVMDQVAFDPDGPDWVAVDGLLARNGARYGDRLVLSGDEEIITYATHRYSVLGIKVYGGAGSTPGQAVFERLLVTPPACERWTEGAEDEADNRPSPNYGCATMSNLARMIVDPNDLIAGSEGTASNDPSFDILAIGRMRTGVLTIATTTEGTQTTGD